MAVEGGLDTLWLGDGYLANPDFTGWAGGMESLTELAWLAGRYRTARTGICAAVLPLRDPAWLAKQANTLQRMAGDGFVLVVTPGFWAHDLESRGIAFGDRGAAFEDRLDDLRRLLLDEHTVPRTLQRRPAAAVAGWGDGDDDPGRGAGSALPVHARDARRARPGRPAVLRRGRRVPRPPDADSNTAHMM